MYHHYDHTQTHTQTHAHTYTYTQAEFTDDFISNTPSVLTCLIFNENRIKQTKQEKVLNLNFSFENMLSENSEDENSETPLLLHNTLRATESRRLVLLLHLKLVSATHFCFFSRFKNNKKTKTGIRLYILIFKNASFLITARTKYDTITTQ